MAENKRTEEWIHIIEPDGTNKIASPPYVKKLLKVADYQSLEFLRNTVNDLANRVYELEKPEKKAKLLNIFHTQGPLDTISLKKFKVEWGILYDLIEDGKIEVIKSKGKAKPRIYQIKAEDKKDA